MFKISHRSNSQLHIWRKPNLLIIGQPDKILRDIRNCEQTSELSAALMETLVSGEKQNVSNLSLHSLCRTAWPRYEIQQSHSPHFLYRQL